jgi:hypothetical protein
MADYGPVLWPILIGAILLAIAGRIPDKVWRGRLQGLAIICFGVSTIIIVLAIWILLAKPPALP